MAKKGHLRLVTDNDPDYKPPHLREIEQLRYLLGEKQQECDEIAKNVRENHALKLKKQKKRYIKMAASAVLGILVIAAGYTSKYNWNHVPKEIVQLNQDLNKDGVNDAYILQKGGHKVPMYGIITYRGVEYVDAREMERRIEDNIIDYESIEDKLNE